MISISTLYCDKPLESHNLRYGGQGRPAGPVVVFNCTMACNLRCEHCYSSNPMPGGELSTAEAKVLIDDLVKLHAPVILFSGGEPTIRPDLLELMKYASAGGIRSTISTNGTLITPQMAREFAAIGVGYIGVSVDGLQETHDRFRRQPGAFQDAMRGIENSRQAGLKVGFRMTLTAHNLDQVDGVLDLMEQRQIPRICFYHLVYTGRGNDLRSADLTAQQRRDVLDKLLDRTAAWHKGGFPAEVLTVDNHADGPYIYLRLLRENPAQAERTLQLLQTNGGNASGVRLVCVKANGNVYPDQFWQTQLLGNIRQRPFSEIWTDTSNELLTNLRMRPRPLSGPRCSSCRWLGVCNGNFRARAEAVTLDIWGDDPSCQLTDEEIHDACPAGQEAAGR